MVLLKKGNKKRKMLLKRPIHSLYGQKKQQLKGSEGYKNPEKARLRPNHTLVREVRSHRNYPLCTTAQFAAARFAAARSPPYIHGFWLSGFLISARRNCSHRYHFPSLAWRSCTDRGLSAPPEVRESLAYPWSW